MKIIYIRPGKSQGYLTLGMHDGEEKHTFTVPESTYSEIGSPEVSTSLSDADMSAIKYSDELYRARMSALRMLSFTDNNERTLVRKLVAKGIGRSVAQDVACEMTERGYIDESRQLLRLVANEANVSLAGPAKIRAKLISKGYSSHDIDVAIDELCATGEIDFSYSAEQLKAKKLTRGATEEEIKKLLYKNGYTVC